ncbi:hypothetical protein MTR67_011767 [Solanum verrucosum]|uniref:Chromo domain-containing protein n=1 Tax=Solanum verrucosum TaxID=315347 RepID=A0AAF0TFF1_SOLVR|nr:hypothetical protein MTR67_011767 [Solanum verrucosum]
MLKKCMGDHSLIIPTEDIGIKDSLSYEEIQVKIQDRQVRKLRTKEVASVKVLWRNQFVEKVTWEAEEDMKKRYPHLFEPGEIPDQDKFKTISEKAKKANGNLKEGSFHTGGAKSVGTICKRDGLEDIGSSHQAEALDGVPFAGMLAQIAKLTATLEEPAHFSLPRALGESPSGPLARRNFHYAQHGGSLLGDGEGPLGNAPTGLAIPNLARPNFQQLSHRDSPLGDPK